MEQGQRWYDAKDLISEVKQGKELAKQLQIHLNAPSSTHATRELLAHKIIISFNKVLAMLNCGTNASTGSTDQHIAGDREIIVTKSDPHFFGRSPKSTEDSHDHGFTSSDSKIDASNKRKAMPRWTKQVKIDPVIGIEESLDDRYSWRKYGQKDILGAKYPRGYYRCSQRHVQGCVATKQIQRSDSDPTLFEITYRGMHTCADQFLNFSPPSTKRSEPFSSLMTTNFHDHQLVLDQKQSSQAVPKNFRPELKLISEDLNFHDQQIDIPTSFYFPSTSNNNNDNFEIFYDMLGEDQHFGANESADSFVSPAAMSGSSNYNLSVWRSNMSGFEGNFQTLHAWDDELSDIIYSATSIQLLTPPTTVGTVNYQLGELEFNSNFTSDNPQTFP